LTDRLLTTRRVADRLGLSVATVLLRSRPGELLGYWIVSSVLRFSGADLEGAA
jgi:hypothetical protein